jgi:hypothetical protein
MAGRFEGLRDLAWPLFADIFPPDSAPRRRGLPHGPFRAGVNPLLSVLLTGCRWGAIPRGRQWASRSAAPRWLRRWPAEGPLAARPARLLGLAEGRGMIQWQYGAVDGAFSPWHRRR